MKSHCNILKQVKRVPYGNKMKQLTKYLNDNTQRRPCFVWRNVLERIIKIIIFLTAGNTALRGHEHKQKCNSEHFDDEGTN